MAAEWSDSENSVWEELDQNDDCSLAIFIVVNLERLNFGEGLFP